MQTPEPGIQGLLNSGLNLSTLFSVVILALIQSHVLSLYTLTLGILPVIPYAGSVPSLYSFLYSQILCLDQIQLCLDHYSLILSSGTAQTSLCALLAARLYFFI